MLPTTYRGAAIIDGERIEAVLHLNADSVRLALDSNQEVLRWPIHSLGIESRSSGSYQLNHGHDSFTFEPSVDDGLDEEISLRRRFSGPPVEFSRPRPPTQPDPETPAPPASPIPAASLVAERVAAEGRHAHGNGVLIRGASRFRRYLLGGALVMTLIVTGAIVATVLDTTAPSTQAAEAPAPATVPVASTFPEPTSADTASEPAPTTPPTVTATPPPTVAGATVTTAPPEPTADAAGSVFELSAAEFAERWDIAVRSHTSALLGENLQVADGEFSFAAGSFVRIQGSTENDVVSRIAFLGDPSGTINDDREVLTGLGMVLSLVEPGLPPEGRRELLLALGFDVENPDVEGLDNTIEYRDHTYWLRWDSGLERLVLDIRPTNGA